MFSRFGHFDTLVWAWVVLSSEPVFPPQIHLAHSQPFPRSFYHSSDLQQSFLLCISKHFLQAVRLFCQSISSHYRPICSPALCWTILLHGLSFFHALSHFPAQFSFVNSLIFIFPIPWSLHSTVGSPCLPHSSIHWEKPHHIHSQPFSWWINPNTPQGAWSGPQEGCITHCICVFSQMVRILVLSD